MPSRVRLTTAYSAERDDDAGDRREHAVPRDSDISSPRRKLPASQAGAGDAVHVVADEQAAHLLEDEDQRVGHQHLLQVVALVEEAEEHPLEQVAEHDREHDADDAAG